MQKNDGLFDWKHLHLWRISSLADVFSSVVIVVYVLLAVNTVFQYNTFAYNQYQTNLIGLFSKSPVYVLDASLRIVKVLLQGVIYYLVLKGIALGLNIVVETDINYRDKKINDGEE